MDIFQTLEFSEEWVDIGIITPAKLSKIESEWNSSDDRNTEHYRWRAFLDFCQSNIPLDQAVLRRLYRLGADDPDIDMGGSMMAHILGRQDCPEDLLREAARSDQKFLRKIANERLV